MDICIAPLADDCLAALVS